MRSIWFLGFPNRFMDVKEATITGVSKMCCPWVCVYDVCVVWEQGVSFITKIQIYPIQVVKNVNVIPKITKYRWKDIRKLV